MIELVLTVGDVRDGRHVWREESSTWRRHLPVTVHMPRFLDAIRSNSSAQRAAHHRFMAITPRSNSTRSESAAPHDGANRSTPREHFPVPRERARDPSLETMSSVGIAEDVVRGVRTTARPVRSRHGSSRRTQPESTAPSRLAGYVALFRTDSSQLNDASSHPSVARICVNSSVGTSTTLAYGSDEPHSCARTSSTCSSSA